MHMDDGEKNEREYKRRRREKDKGLKNKERKTL